MNFVKLYGLNHSGSHYLSWLLNNNFKDMVILHSHTGWNHGAIVDYFDWDSMNWNDPSLSKPKKERQSILLKQEELNSGKSISEYKTEIESLYKNKELPLLILMRNPISWIHSYNIVHEKQHWESTLNSAIDLWNKINKNYIENSWPKKHIIKYENLRDNTKEEMIKISNFLGLELNDDFTNTKKDAVQMSNRISEISKFRNSANYDRCKQDHMLVYGLESDEFDEIVENNFDKEVINFYNNL